MESDLIEQFIEKKSIQALKTFLTAEDEKSFTSAAIKIADAFGVFSINEDPVYELIFNYPKWLKDEIKKKFREITKKNLLSELQSDYTDPIRSSLDLFLSAERNDNPEPDKEKCESFAKLLTETDPNDWMTNEEILENFATFSPEELTLTCRYYAKICGNGAGIIDALKMMRKSCKKFLKNLLYYVTIPPLKYAMKLNDLLANIDLPKPELDKQLLDIIGSRHDVDLPLINEFYKKFGVDIRDEIANKLSNYEKEPVYQLINSYFKKAYVKEALKDKIKFNK